MNNNRRKRIQDVIRKLQILLEEILDEEQEAFENMPESLQESENGMISQDAQDNLDAAIEALEEAIDYLEEIQ